MELFDYCYYRIYAFYKYSTKERTPDILTNCAITLLQMLNFSSLVFFLAIILVPDYPIKNWYGVVLTLCLLVINHYRYKNNHSFYFLEKKWKHEPRKKEIQNVFFVMAYIISSVAVFLSILINLDTLEYYGYYFRL